MSPTVTKLKPGPDTLASFAAGELACDLDSVTQQTHVRRRNRRDRGHRRHRGQGGSWWVPLFPDSASSPSPGAVTLGSPLQGGGRALLGRWQGPAPGYRGSVCKSLTS